MVLDFSEVFNIIPHGHATGATQYLFAILADTLDGEIGSRTKNVIEVTPVPYLDVLAPLAVNVPPVKVSRYQVRRTDDVINGVEQEAQ